MNDAHEEKRFGRRGLGALLLGVAALPGLALDAEADPHGTADSRTPGDRKNPRKHHHPKPRRPVCLPLETRAGRRCKSRYPARWTIGGPGDGPGEFDQIGPLYIDATDTMLIGDAGNGRVQLISSDGVFQSAFSLGALTYISGLTLDNSGNILVLEKVSQRVRVYDNPGSFVREFPAVGTTSLAGSIGDTLTVGPSGDIYVIDTGRNEIHRLNSAGVWQQSGGGNGTGPGKLQAPTGVAVSGDGTVFVADFARTRVLAFSPDLKFRREWDPTASPRGIEYGMSAPAGIVFSGGALYVTDAGGAFRLFRPNGQLLARGGVTGQAGGGPNGIAVDSRGRVFTTSYYDNLIKVNGAAAPTG